MIYRVESRERRVESQKLGAVSGVARGHLTSGIRRLASRSGVTLVELLIVITIITILASLILGVAAVAGETARKAQTKTTVQRIHKLLMEHYDTYKTRRVAVRQQVLEDIETRLLNKQITPAIAGRRKAEARLNALRELMIMEIPDRWSDITLSPNPNQIGYPYFLDVSKSAVRRTDLSAMYLRRYQQLKQQNNNWPTVENQSAECLYLLITLATGDGEARSQFGESAIGDTDGDGAFEFLDAWGNPIGFLRAAPGFDSVIQVDANTLGMPQANNQVWMTAASGDHDPFDLYRVDAGGIRLIPLVFSAGGDGEYGLIMMDEYVPLRGIPNIQAAANISSWPQRLPYFPVSDENGNDVFLGTAFDRGAATDNIHNHLLGRR